jgi:hypothetical protein
MQRPDRVRRTAGLVDELIDVLARIVADYAEPNDLLWRSTGTAVIQNESTEFCEAIDSAAFQNGDRTSFIIDAAFGTIDAQYLLVGLGNPKDRWRSKIVVTVDQTVIQFDDDIGSRKVGFDGALTTGNVRIGLTIDLTAPRQIVA